MYTESVPSNGNINSFSNADANGNINLDGSLETVNTDSTSELNVSNSNSSSELNIPSKSDAEVIPKKENLITVSVSVVVQSTPLSIIESDKACVEDLIVQVCRILKIGPVARHLFALRAPGTELWLNLAYPITRIPNGKFVLRIRFNVPDLNKLKILDTNAYNYYYHQAKQELLNSSIPDLNFNQYKSEIIGLCVVDMHRVTLEEKVTKEEVIKNYKKYIPDKIQKQHSFFMRKPLRRKLNEISPYVSVSFAKSGYLEQLKRIAPSYLTEYYNCVQKEGNDISNSVRIRVNPFHEDQPGTSLKRASARNWEHICTIDDLCYLTLKGECVEISRKSGIPISLHFMYPAIAESFVSLLDGYYRLSVKWTFNLCKELPTPSLTKLQELRCHGPISGEVAYSKLANKRNNTPGCYILRQSNTDYDSYYIDVCVKTCVNPKTYKINKESEGKYYLKKYEDAEKKPEDFVETYYPTLIDLLKAYKNGNDEFILKECLPPSEFDQSNLLICQNPNSVKVQNSEDVQLSDPICIRWKDLNVVMTNPQTGRNPYTIVFRSIWKHKNTSRMVIIKRLKDEFARDQEKIGQFQSLIGVWAHCSSSAMVKSFGITLNPLAMVMEHLPYGTLDVYLANPDNRRTLKEVDLVEACTYLANALWYLESNGCVHGKVRCRKLWVANRTNNSFVIKLADPGIHHKLPDEDIHWVPPEFYNNIEQARFSSGADMWAFGTTMWEIFTYGCLPPVMENSVLKNFYSSGKTLTKPSNCPNSVYYLMMDCWRLDPYLRKKPQAAMRDINQVLYEVYNNRQRHAYSTVTDNKDAQLDSVSQRSKESDDFNSSLISENTVNTFVDEDQSFSITLPDWQQSNSIYGAEMPDSYFDAKKTYEVEAPASEFSPQFVDLNLSSLQSIYELDSEWNVVLMGRIGVGHYGEVYKGMLQHMYEEDETQEVAVKKLKPEMMSTVAMKDFEREIDIMKRLDHPNIVSIKGIIRDPELCLVLEYIEHGSLRSYLNIYREKLSTHHLLKYCWDVARGMEYLGYQKILHRDLAARNILVVNEFQVKISDFGLAKFLGNEAYYLNQTVRDIPIAWYAPESLEFAKYSTRSDVWSFGVTMHEIFTYGGEPRLSITTLDIVSIVEALKKDVRLPRPSACPLPIYRDIMTECWHYEASKRPTFPQLSYTIEMLYRESPKTKFWEMPPIQITLPPEPFDRETFMGKIGL